MKRILFVDDEPNVLDGLRRMLFSMRNEWAVEFANSGAQALDRLSGNHFDVVVTDMRMPGMDGATLLARVRERAPDTLRFVLTGQSDSETVYRSVGDAHQFLTKPCKPEVLKDSIERVLNLKELLTSAKLRAMVAQIGALPPRPQVYSELCEELQSSDGAISNVGSIIERDVALTAKILQLANSAFFGLRQHVSTATQAASFLGFDTIKALVLATGLFDHLEKQALPEGFPLEWLWRHCMTVGAAARAIAQSEGLPVAAQCDAYTAGLLHDAGMLVLAMSRKKEYLSVSEHAQKKRILLTEAESQLLDCTHAEIGAYLLGIWGLPTPIVEAVAYHHHPGTCAGSEFSPLTAVHLADVLTTTQGSDCNYPAPIPDSAYLERLGCTDRLPALSGLCQSIRCDKEN